METVNIYSDGACSGNPGPGGWATIVLYKTDDIVLKEEELSGYQDNTTNNQMELTAIIEGLKSLEEICNVNIYSDSQYVCNAFNKNWIKNWQTNNWRTSNNKPVKNQLLWQELIRLCDEYRVTFNWIKGHNNNFYNERCDKLAVAAYQNHI